MVKAAPLVAALALFACGDAEVKKEDVEKLTMDQLAASVGNPAPPVTCPGALKAKVGATLTCAMTMPIDHKVYDVNLKVTSVSGDTAHFDIAVADKPRGE